MVHTCTPLPKDHVFGPYSEIGEDPSICNHSSKVVHSSRVVHSQMVVHSFIALITSSSLGEAQHRHNKVRPTIMYSSTIMYPSYTESGSRRCEFHDGCMRQLCFILKDPSKRWVSMCGRVAFLFFFISFRYRPNDQL